MRKNFVNKKQKCLILCLMLIVAIALSAAGCGEKAKSEVSQTSEEAETTARNQILGEGKTKIFFSVVDEAGRETKFEIHTDRKTVGEALTENNLIEGEDGQYGLYVKTVNGISADFEKDGAYWAFYENGEYASAGVDVTPVKEGSDYAFKVEKK